MKMKSIFETRKLWVLHLGVGASILALLGCGPSGNIGKEKSPPPPPTAKKAAVPDIIIHIASVNLVHLSKRIEREDIEKLAGILKREKIDIFAVQAISRYPEVRNRTDFVDELAAQAEMRSAFGETISISGRQNGNAIFSAYPIRTTDNTHYVGSKSTGFEAALQALIDCGARDVVMVSTQLPEKSTSDEQISCVKTLASFQKIYDNDPVVIAGNLPRLSILQSIGFTEDIQPVDVKNPGKNDPPKIWYINHQALAPADPRVVETELGPLFVTQFGIFRKPYP